MGKITRFFELPGLERRLFLEAVWWCGIARLAMLVLPFRKYSRLLGKARGELGEGETGDPGNKTDDPTLKHIARAVRRAGRNVPWQSRCLVRAMAAKQMLRRRGIGGTVYLGVTKDSAGGMIAHAWLTSGGRILTGYRAVNKYSTLSVFR